MRHETLIHSQTSMVQPLKSMNGKGIPSHTLLYMRLFIHDGIEVYAECSIVTSGNVDDQYTNIID